MPLGASIPKRSGAPASFEPVDFGALPGWESDDHRAALDAFARSAGPLLRRAAAVPPSANTAGPSPELLRACELAIELAATLPRAGEARRFFESRFTPQRVVHAADPGLLTGYYEPVLDGRLAREPGFEIPVYKRPPDLVNLVAEHERGAMAHGLTHARSTPAGTEPYPTRREIELGALASLGEVLVWLADPVDAFFMHVQGSGRIRLADGRLVGITYDGKNGHPYTSIGRYLIDNGLMAADGMTLASLKEWLSADPDRAREVLWQNQSYVFFRKLEGAESDSALGSLEIPLTAGRSLAVDTAYHVLGTPVYVVAPTIRHGGDDAQGFRRLMVAQDVGSAIRGPERGDIYFGSGDEAGRLAGITKHPGTFFVLHAVPLAYA